MQSASLDWAAFHIWEVHSPAPHNTRHENIFGCPRYAGHPGPPTSPDHPVGDCPSQWENGESKNGAEGQKKPSGWEAKPRARGLAERLLHKAVADYQPRQTITNVTANVSAPLSGRIR